MDINVGFATSGLTRLEQIRIKNKQDLSWVNQDLYRLLYKDDLYRIAYEKFIAKKKTRGQSNSKTGSDLACEELCPREIQQIIERMRENTYAFQPAQTSLRQKASRDQIVQEVLRMILEVIYEPVFAKRNHVCLHRSPHSALQQIDHQFDGVKWLIEGKIQAANSMIDHKILLSLLRRRIQDERFLQLIKKALKAGYLEGAAKPVQGPMFASEPRFLPSQASDLPSKSFAFSKKFPLSPILFDIYLSPLDDFIRQQREFYLRGNADKNRKTTTEYNANATKMAKIKRSLKQNEESFSMHSEERKKLVTDLRRLRKERVNIQAYRQETVPISISYVRYDDQWILGVNGPHDLAVAIKQEMTEFLHTELKLHLSHGKTKILYLKKDVGFFLGYEIRIGTSIKTKKLKNAQGVCYTKRVTGHFVELCAPIQKLISSLARKGLCDGKGYPQSKRSWTTLEDHQIVQQYRWMMHGLFQYYSGAVNQRKLLRIQFILQHSCACTLAHRHQCSVSSIYSKHGKSMRVKHTVETKMGRQQRWISLFLRKFNKEQIKWFLRRTFFNPFQTYAYRRTK